ncbi:MAG TPA: type I 3-dehydroquinate dehydratase [Bacteroidia bacterium]|jgi:3-dehydroquinate dehydratase-1|nr:type I 3-dehydroquinate dehydratase [Bacteroidia bacterium]
MRMPFKICTVVQGNTLPLFLRNLSEAKRTVKMVELRADSIENFEEEDINTLKKSVTVSSIFTFRHVKEGGLFSGDIKEQKTIIKTAFSSGFEYVDVSYGNSLVKGLSSKEKKKLLLSYHDYKVTPSPDKLKALLNKMRKESPAVIKIATMVTKPSDIFILAELLKEKKEKEKLIIIGMGEMGKITRVLFPIMGSYFTYASLEGKQIAPGLMTYKEMQSVYNIIAKS